MRCYIPQITWNSREPVSSVDFDPTCKYEDGFYRLASGGADTQLLIWHICQTDAPKPTFLCVAELKRHLKTINIVRFSPDGNYIASADDDAFVLIWKNETKSEKEESWLVEKTLRRHLEDVSDLCWSPDGSFLVSGSVDNSAILWDVKKGTAIHNWSDHVGFVNGVCYDPFNEYVATMCIDRTLRFYNAKSGKISHKLQKFAPPWMPEATAKSNMITEETSAKNLVDETSAKNIVIEENVVKIDDENTENPSVVDKENEMANSDGPTTETIKKPHAAAPINRMFCDADDTFCRRMMFSPKGELLMVPGGLLPPRNVKENQNGSVAVPNADITLASSPGDGKLKGKNKVKKFGEKPATNTNAVLVFCRNSFSTPCAVIPTGTSFSTAIRFSPVYYERDRVKFNYGPTLVNPTTKEGRMTSCVGRIKAPVKTKRYLMDMPYRLIYTVATNNSIIIGDTASSEPLAHIKNIHCTRITDVSWSADGRVCISSSTDGYCSLITFEKDELGVEFPLGQVSSELSDCFPVSPPKKSKPKIVKKKDVKVKPLIFPITTPKAIEKSKVESTVVVEEDKDSDENQSPKKKPLQKNTLLKWVIKKPKSEEESSVSDKVEDKTSNSDEKPEPSFQKPISEPELICLDSSSCEALPMDTDTITLKSQPVPEKKPTTPSIATFFKAKTSRLDINQLELLKLQTAPIKNTELMEASIAENLHGIPMDVESLENNSKNKSATSTKMDTVQSNETTKNSDSVGKTDSSPTKSNTTSTSPMTSSTSKPSRRIQLITLTTVAPKKGKGNLD